MKVVAFVLLLAISAIECRKIVQINKHDNIDFINMESGGGVGPNNVRVPPGPAVPTPSPAKPPQSPSHSEPPKSPVPQPKSPAPATTVKVAPVPMTPVTPTKPIQPKPVQPLPNQMDLKPVPAKPASSGGVTTPGYGNVKQLVTFYDSQGKASVIRPYSYSQAVKQG